MSIIESIFKAANTSKALTKVWIGGQTADNLKDATPVLDVERDVNSDTINHLISGNAETAQRIRYGAAPLVIPFEIAFVPASLSNQDALPFGWTGQKTIGLFKKATLVGIYAQTVDPLSAGTITIRPQINGVNTALQAAISSGGDNQRTRVYQLVEQADPLDLYTAPMDQIGLQVDADVIVPNSRRFNGLLFWNVGEEEEI